MSLISSEIVVLSARIRNVEFVELDMKTVVAREPPGRLELSGLPYYNRASDLV